METVSDRGLIRRSVPRRRERRARAHLCVSIRSESRLEQVLRGRAGVFGVYGANGGEVEFDKGCEIQHEGREVGLDGGEGEVAY